MILIRLLLAEDNIKMTIVWNYTCSNSAIAACKLIQTKPPYDPTFDWIGNLIIRARDIANRGVKL